MSLHGAMWYAPRLSAPRCPNSVMAPESLGEIPSANAKVMVLSIYLPTTRGGWPKATRHENVCLLNVQNQDYHCHCPPKSVKKVQQTGGTVAHSLQVLHTLLRYQPSKNERTLPCCSSQPGLPDLHTHATGMAFMGMSQDLVAHL